MKIVYFLLLVFGAILINYYAPAFFSTAFFLGVLFAYFRSEDEPFFLAFFFVLADGAFGFFGRYEASISAVPGLPAIEVGQLYIILSIVKAYKKEVETPLFFSSFLRILVIYFCFLILQGFAVGISAQVNTYFRLIKLVLPFFLIYSLPRLMVKKEDYQDLFSYLFPIAVGALLVQVFTISLGHTPMQYFGAIKKDVWFAREITEDTTYRGFFNPDILIITLLGALYFLANRQSRFSFGYLVCIYLCNFFSVFLSASRGWTLSFLIIGLLFLLTVFKVSINRMVSLALVGAIVVMGLFSLPIVKIQVNNALDRIMTIEAVAKGDLTAGGTLSRLDVRGPAVMRRWAESPLTGWGFSDYFFRYNDLHVGNQNVLLHSGIIGGLLLALFFFNFVMSLIVRNRKLPAVNPGKGALLVFVIVFLGWFFLHSTGVQQFGYFVLLSQGIAQSIFFCFAGFAYNLNSTFNGKNATRDTQEEDSRSLRHVASWSRGH